MQLEAWVDHKAQSLECESLVKSGAQLEQELARYTHFTKKDNNSHLKHLLASVNHTLDRKDRQAVDDLHKYFDYSMRTKWVRKNNDTGLVEFDSWAVKVHQPALNLAGLRFRLGQLD